MCFFGLFCFFGCVFVVFGFLVLVILVLLREKGCCVFSGFLTTATPLSVRVDVEEAFLEYGKRKGRL